MTIKVSFDLLVVHRERADGVRMESESGTTVFASAVVD